MRRAILMAIMVGASAPAFAHSTLFDQVSACMEAAKQSGFACMETSSDLGDEEGVHECARTARERVHACAAAIDHPRRSAARPLSGKAGMCGSEWPHNAAMRRFCVDAQEAGQ
jgi:hypothetical protein